MLFDLELNMAPREPKVEPLWYEIAIGYFAFGLFFEAH